MFCIFPRLISLFTCDWKVAHNDPENKRMKKMSRYSQYTAFHYMAGWFTNNFLYHTVKVPNLVEWISVFTLLSQGAIFCSTADIFTVQRLCHIMISLQVAVLENLSDNGNTIQNHLIILKSLKYTASPRLTPEFRS